MTSYSRGWSNRPQKRTIQDKLSRRLYEHYLNVPELHGKSIVSLAGKNFQTATRGYYSLAEYILVAERDPSTYSQILSDLSFAWKENKCKKIMLIKGPIDVVDAVKNLPEDKRPISGVDLDFDIGGGSPISSYIEVIREKFFQLLSLSAFWLRITVPLRGTNNLDGKLQKLIKAVPSSHYNIIDVAGGPSFCYKDTAAMVCLQIIAKGKGKRDE